jgi:cystathionine beta-lyase/cystathionine gamma-synthase
VTGFSTRAIRAATRAPKVDQRPNAVPIYQSATFSSADSDELAAVTNDQVRGFAYSRLDNPTSAALGEAMAELEGAAAGFGLASGMAAIHATVTSLLTPGGRIVFPEACYGSTRTLFRGRFGALGIRVDAVDLTDLAAVEAALAEAPTTVLYAETVANPTVVVSDIAALAELAHRRGARLVVDNTFASPYLCRPMELGADLVIESATKYLSGHSDVIAGVVVGSGELVEAVRQTQIDTGATLSPFSAFLVLRGIATLVPRMERHQATASALASWLERQDGVTQVRYPGLPSHPQYALAERQLRSGGGMLTLELAAGRAGGQAFIDAMTIPERTASLGSIHTIVAHPPSTTHRQLSDAELAASGITPGLLRVSVGLEDLDDLVADFERALAAARAAGAETDPTAAGAVPDQLSVGAASDQPAVDTVATAT